jgi:Probable Zinc-ribbon domain
MTRRGSFEHGRPLGRLATGELYYAPIGAMLYDGDRACCHLCGRWLRLVGGQHLIAAHGITLLEYREMFCLFGNVTTAAPDLTERKRSSMLDQIASGERDQSVLGAPSPPTVGRWRSLAVLRPELARELHPTRNGELDPSVLGQRSHRGVWWRCAKCGHEWRTSPNERTSAGKGCPACGRRRSIAATVDRNRRAQVPRERSLAVVRPDLLQEWHPTRNGGLDPATVGAGSERKVWWTCSSQKPVAPVGFPNARSRNG